MKILITDGENRSSLAVTRSLGKKGCEVYVAGAEGATISSASRFCRGSFRTPSPLKDGKGYASAMTEIVSRERFDVVFPTTEQSIYLLNGIRDRLPQEVILACPLQEKMDAVSNKYRLFQAAEKAGIPVPKTVYVKGGEEFPSLEGMIPGFPVVVKPSYSKIAAGGEVISASVMYAADRDALRSLYRTKPVLRYPSLIQELVVGEGTGVFSLFDHDRHLVLFSHRRVLEKPPSGGVSVVSESVPLDPEMVEGAAKLLSEVGWRGVAMVEFKRDVRDGRAKLMEIKGRFWGSLQLAISSGVDFPALYLDYCLGRKPSSLLDQYRVGHKMKWFFGVLDHLIARLRQKDRRQTLPPGSYTLWQVLMALLATGGSEMSQDVFDREDLKPFLYETSSYFRDLVGIKPVA